MITTKSKLRVFFTGGLQSQSTALLAGLVSVVGILVGIWGVKVGWVLLPRLFGPERDEGLALLKGMMAIVWVPAVIGCAGALVVGLFGLPASILAYIRIRKAAAQSAIEVRTWITFRLWIRMFWFLLLAWPIVLIFSAAFLDTLGASAAWNVLVWLAWFGCLLLSGWKAIRLQCPRCNRRFFLSTRNWSAFYSKCRHCDLRKYEPFDAAA